MNNEFPIDTPALLRLRRKTWSFRLGVLARLRFAWRLCVSPEKQRCLKMIVLLLDPVAFVRWPLAGLDIKANLRRRIARRLVLLANPESPLTLLQFPKVQLVDCERLQKILRGSSKNITSSLH